MPAGGVEAVRIEGLRELRRAFAKVDVGFALTAKEMQRDIARKVADRARDRAESEGGSLAKGATSIKAPPATARGASVQFGGPKAPWMAGAEFGSVRYAQFREWTGNAADAGYAVFPTIREMADEIEDLSIKFVNRLLEIFST